MVNKIEFLNSRIADLNDHLLEIMDQTGKKFNIIKENVSKKQKKSSKKNDYLEINQV